MMGVSLAAGLALADPPALQESLREVRLDITPEPLRLALTQFAQQTGMQLLFSEDDVPLNARAPRLVGTFTLQRALEQLLARTALHAQFINSRTVAIHAGESAQSSMRADKLSGGIEVQTPSATAAKGDQSLRDPFLVGQADQSFSNVTSTNGLSQNSPAESEKPAVLQEIVVTAQKREERLQDVPVSVTVLNPDTLAENGQDRLVDYYATVPGMTLSASGNGNNYIALRGLSSGAGQNPLVATVIDDVPAMASTSVAGGQITSPDLDPSDLARIEVLKGPQGTLYGADSLSGLIKYVTADPSMATWSGRLEVAGDGIPDGDLGYRVRGAVNMPVSDTFALRMSGFYRHDPGYIDQLTTGEKNFNSSDVSGVHFAVLWHPSDSFSAKLSALVQQAKGSDSFFDSTVSGQSAHSGLGLYALPGSVAYSTQYQLYSVNLDWKVHGLDITSITGYVVNSYTNVTDWTGSLGGALHDCYYGAPLTCQLDPSTPPGIIGAVSANDSITHKVSQELRVGSSLGHWLDWRLGGFYTHESNPTNFGNFYGADPTTGATLFTSYTNDFIGGEFNEYATFGDLTAHLTDRFDLEAGGRQSWNNQKNQSLLTGKAVYLFTQEVPPVFSPLFQASGSSFTYQVTPEFKFTPDLMVYARIATGYRIGGYNQNAFAAANSNLGVPQSYAPDKTINYEIGIKGNLFEHALTFSAAAYHVDWSDFQASVTRGFTVPDTGATAYVGYVLNGGHAKSDGLELALEAHPLWGLTIALQYSYTNAVLTQDLPTGSSYGPKGFPLPYSTKNSAGVSINQDIRLTNDWTGFVGGSANYIGAVPQEFTGDPTQPRIVYPGYTQLNFHLGTRHDTWLMNLYLNNATNRLGVIGITNWYSLNTPYGYTATIIQPRTIGVSVAKSF